MNAITEAQIPRPYAVLYQLIPQSSKDIEHIHVDFIYAMEADEVKLTTQLEEVSHAKWMSKEEILNTDCFDSVKGFVNNFLK
jgi:isopentenyldiphosphate isomerase